MTIDALRSSFTGTILVEADEGFDAFAFAAGSPSAIARPRSVDDVVAALRHAVDGGLAVSVRSGGHSGGSHTSVAGGLVLDMSTFDAIDVSGTTVTIGTGATWGQVAQTLEAHGLALSSGDTKSVGVGGLTLGGGVGWLVRQYGLALDSLRSATVVTAAGKVVTASGTENSDLFWAIRGGGGNFGVVTDFSFEAHPLDAVVHGVISYDTDDLAELLRGYRDVMRSAPEQLNVTFMQFPGMGPEMPGGPTLHVVWGGGDLDEAMRHIQPLLELPGVTSHDIVVKPYADALDDPHPPEAGTAMPVIVGNNGWALELTDQLIDDLVAADNSLDGSVLMIRYLRGAFNRVAADATAFAWRAAEALIISVAFLPPDADETAIAAVNAGWVPVAAHTRGTYGNFVTEASDRVVELMYPTETRRRLGTIKRKWDPTNLFNQNQNVRPI